MGPNLEAMWQKFERQVVPADAGEVQRLEMHRAFVAGAWSVLCALPLFGLGGGQSSASILREQCEAFIRNVIAGKN